MLKRGLKILKSTAARAASSSNSPSGSVALQSIKQKLEYAVNDKDAIMKILQTPGMFDVVKNNIRNGSSSQTRNDAIFCLWRFSFPDEGQIIIFRDNSLISELWVSVEGERSDETRMRIYRIILNVATPYENSVKMTDIVDELMIRVEHEPNNELRVVQYNIISNISIYEENAVKFIALIPKLMTRSKLELHDETRCEIYKTLANLATPVENAWSIAPLLPELMRRALHETYPEARMHIYAIIQNFAYTEEEISQIPKTLISELVKRSSNDTFDGARTKILSALQNFALDRALALEMFSFEKILCSKVSSSENSQEYEKNPKIRAIIYEILSNIAAETENAEKMLHLAPIFMNLHEPTTACRVQIYSLLQSLTSVDKNAIELIDEAGILLARTNEEENECKAAIFSILANLASVESNVPSLSSWLPEISTRVQNEQDELVREKQLVLIQNLINHGDRELRVSMPDLIKDIMIKIKQVNQSDCRIRMALILQSLSVEHENKLVMGSDFARELFDFGMEETNIDLKICYLGVVANLAGEYAISLVDLAPEIVQCMETEDDAESITYLAGILANLAVPAENKPSLVKYVDPLMDLILTRGNRPTPVMNRRSTTVSKGVGRRPTSVASAIDSVVVSTILQGSGSDSERTFEGEVCRLLSSLVHDISNAKALKGNVRLTEFLEKMESKDNQFAITALGILDDV